jgi:L-amino acid N-acyltransferase YncA
MPDYQQWIVNRAILAGCVAEYQISPVAYLSSIMPTLRVATPADAKGMLDIYGPFITETSFTFETELPSREAFAERIRSYCRHWPWLVCEKEGVVAGFAYGARYRERKGYQWCVESSVYIHPDHHRSGFASMLYSALFELMKVQGYRNVYAVINLPNDISVAFHEKMGFKHFATYPKVGYKLGKWKDVGWWQLTINGHTQDPSAPLEFEYLDHSDVVEPIIRKANRRPN